jgi:hypothetical protein
VLRVIVVSNSEITDENGNESESLGVAFCQNLFGGVWKQTSYNANIRKNYAGIGYTYREDIDAFVSPGPPYPSWTLDLNTAQWVAPVPLPEDANTGQPPKTYYWDEATLSWILINPLPVEP